MFGVQKDSKSSLLGRFRRWVSGLEWDACLTVNWLHRLHLLLHGLYRGTGLRIHELRLLLHRLHRLHLLRHIRVHGLHLLLHRGTGLRVHRLHLLLHRLHLLLLVLLVVHLLRLLLLVHVGGLATTEGLNWFTICVTITRLRDHTRSSINWWPKLNWLSVWVASNGLSVHA